jgi:hypothetical protein
MVDYIEFITSFNKKVSNFKNYVILHIYIIPAKVLYLKE